MLSITFIPVDYDYFDWKSRNYVRIIGRDDKGRRVCIVDSYEPYFWAIFKQDTTEKKIKELQQKIEKIKIEQAGRITKVEKTELHNKKFLGKDVKALKIFITNYKDAHAIADKIDYPEIEALREYDLNLITKYIIDKKLVPLTWHKISGEILEAEYGLAELDVDICIKAEQIDKTDQKTFEPKILAFDIEADEFEIGKGEILMISIVGKNFKKVLTWKKVDDAPEFVEFCKDEAEMLEKFVECVKEQAPDMLVGYFSDGFDLPYLRARAEKNQVKLALGIDGSQPSFTRGRITSARISGIVHVDLLRFIETVYSPYMQSETLGLDEVAREFLGEGKKDFEHKHSTKLKEYEWLDYFEYNLQDSLLTLKLAEKFLPDMLEFCNIIQEPLFEITRDSMSQLVESYIIHHLNEYNEIAEKRPLHDEIEERRRKGRYEGAFVLQPTPGLYENVVMFDFTSMYSSVIVTYNLSKSTFLGYKKIRDSYEAEIAEGRVYFTKQPGFFPRMLKDMIEKRKKYKAEYKQDPSPVKRARSNAYKLLANACYGYQGFFGARYYCREAAAATAALARKSILATIEKIKAAGYQVIYSDTDSIAFLRGNKNKQEILSFLEKLNSGLPGVMELELEDFYARGIWVTKRTGEFGAKKKYALITEDGKLKIRGFETVRRDWCSLARELQNEVLLRILKEGNEKSALAYTKKIIQNLKERKVKKEDIIIRTQLKKPLSEYKAITPHVIAAKKMEKQGMPIAIGMLVQYFIAETRETKKLVREKVKLPDEKGEYDIQYYLEHQIVPAVENIFEVFGIKKEELLGKKQKSLTEF